MDTPDVSIVLLTYNGWSLTHQLLMDIKRHCYGVREVVVVDNGSDDVDVEDGLKFWMKTKVLPIRVETLAINKGFIGGANHGLQKALGKVACLLSNDVRIYSRRFMDNLVQTFREDEHTLTGGIVYRGNTGWNQFGGVVYPYVEGWCVATTRDNWKALEYFDTRFAPSDYEDVDLSTKALRLGMSLEQAPDGSIVHLGGKTYGYTDERRARTERNRKIFEEKWVR